MLVTACSSLLLLGATALGPVGSHIDLQSSGAQSSLLAPRKPSASHAEALLESADEHNLVEVQPPATTTTSEGFLERMQNALTGFLIGLVLLLFSVPVLWVNESHNAKMESLIAYASSHCRTVAGKAAEDSNRHTLVHLQGEQAKAVGRVADDDFEVKFDGGCIHLARDVSVYQWVEHQKKEEREKLGGGKETTITYSYKKEWSSSWNDSSAFGDRNYRGLNKRPNNLELGRKVKTAARVDYGEGFVLTSELVDKCSDYKSASEKIGKSIKCSGGFMNSCTFTKTDDDHYYHSTTGSSNYHSAEIGDTRVKFTYVPDGPYSAVALQARGKDRETFLPYRLIKRGWCGINEDEEKDQLKTQGEKSTSDLADEAGCPGPLACICCACNLVMKCFAAAVGTEIYDVFPGSLSQSECFKRIASKEWFKTWCFRIVGWVMMFGGLYLLFGPFLLIIRALPFIGPFLSDFGGGLIWFLCGFTTLIIASAIIVLAYLVFHPLLGLLYGGLATALVVGVVVLSRAMVASS